MEILSIEDVNLYSQFIKYNWQCFFGLVEKASKKLAKNVWSKVFWYAKVLYSEPLLGTLYIEIKTKC